jgi:hypothetical protein
MVAGVQYVGRRRRGAYCTGGVVVEIGVLMLTYLEQAWQSRLRQSGEQARTASESDLRAAIISGAGHYRGAGTSNAGRGSRFRSSAAYCRPNDRWLGHRRTAVAITYSGTVFTVEAPRPVISGAGRKLRFQQAHLFSVDSDGISLAQRLAKLAGPAWQSASESWRR